MESYCILRVFPQCDFYGFLDAPLNSEQLCLVANITTLSVPPYS